MAAPVLLYAYTNTSSPTNLILVYDQTLNTASLATSKFTGTINGTPFSGISSANASGTNVTLVILDTITTGDIVLLTYIPGASGSRIANASAEFAAGFTNAVVSWGVPSPAVITFPSLPTKTVGDADFAPGASSTNTVTPITYASDNTSVATIVSGNIHIVGAGTSQITASQAAGNGYGAATDVIRTLTVNSNSNSNNMATNAIEGDVVGLWYSTVLSSPQTSDWKEIVCAENTGIDGSADVNSRRTKCGTIKSVSPAAFTITGSGAANHTPGTGKASATELLNLFQNGTPVLLKVASSTASQYFRQTNDHAVLSSYSETANTGESVGFDFTFDVTGDFDLTA